MNQLIHPSVRCLLLCAERLGRPEDPAEEVDHLPQGQDGLFGPRIRAASQHPAQRVRPAGSGHSEQHFLRCLWPGMVRDNSKLPVLFGIYSVSAVLCSILYTFQSRRSRGNLEFTCRATSDVSRAPISKILNAQK